MKKLLTILFLFVFAGFVNDPGGGGHHTPSTTLLTINQDWIADMNAIPGKSAKPLFDGNTTTHMNENGIDQGNFVMPHESFVVLPHKVSNTSIEWYDKSGSSATLEITLYRERYNASSVDVVVDSLMSFIPSTGTFNTWVAGTGLGIEDVDSVFMIRIRALHKDAFDQTITELKIYGDSVGPAPDLFHTFTDTLSDDGKYGFAMGQYGASNMDTLALTAWTERIMNVPGQKQSASDSDAALTAYRYKNHDNALFPDGDNSSTLNKVRSYGMKYNWTVVGGPIGGVPTKYLSDAVLAAPYNYGDWVGGTIYKKYMNKGSDSILLSVYTGFGHWLAMNVGLYGGNASHGRTYVYEGITNTAQGQGGISYVGIQNEWMRNWIDGEAHYSVKAIYAAMRVGYDSVKAVDPNMPVYIGALTSMSRNVVFSLSLAHYLATRNTIPGPWDGIDFNTYMNTTYGFQSFTTADSAITPERFQLPAKLDEFCRWVDSCLGNIRKSWTEVGFATHVNSPYNVIAIGSYTADQVKGIMGLRTYELGRSVIGGPSQIYWYNFITDGSVEFGTMHAARDSFNEVPAYVTTLLEPVGFLLAQQKTLYTNYNWHNDHVVDGDSTGVHVTVSQHSTNPLKKIFTVWRGNYSTATTSNYVLDLGTNALSAVRYDMSFTTHVPATSVPTISSNTITVPTVDIKPIHFEVTYGTAPDPIIRTSKFKKGVKNGTP